MEEGIQGEISLTPERISEILTILEMEPDESTIYQLTKEWFHNCKNFDRLAKAVEEIERKTEKTNTEIRIVCVWPMICAKRPGSPYNEEFFRGMDETLTELEQINEIEDEEERNRRLDEFWSRED